VHGDDLDTRQPDKRGVGSTHILYLQVCGKLSLSPGPQCAAEFDGHAPAYRYSYGEAYRCPIPCRHRDKMRMARWRMDGRTDGWMDGWGGRGGPCSGHGCGWRWTVADTWYLSAIHTQVAGFRCGWGCTRRWRMLLSRVSTASTYLSTCCFMLCTALTDEEKARQKKHRRAQKNTKKQQKNNKPKKHPSIPRHA